MRFLVLRILQFTRTRVVYGRVLDADRHVGCRGILITCGSSRVFRCWTHRASDPMWIPASHGDVEEILQCLSVPARYAGRLDTEVTSA